MRYHKTIIATNILFLAITLTVAITFLTINTAIGYILSAVFFGASCYVGYYFYRLLWLHKWGRPLTEEKKLKREQYRKQMRDYQRYNLYNRIYRFADATEEEYQAGKAKQQQNRNSR